MSYCRFSEDSDVYLYPHVYGGYQCAMCRFKQGVASDGFDTLGEVLEHLQRHKDAGHLVPKHAFDLVKAEIEEYGEDYDNPWDGFT